MITSDRKCGVRSISSKTASAKINDRHLSRIAIVYVRQSSPQQVLENRESRERQYALADYASELGWPSDRILIIDDDQGISGKSADNRPGFQRLLSEVSLKHVGLVLGLELSRLSRSSSDWHHLIDVCGVFGTLLCDEDRIYDPLDSNDRLLLGMKRLEQGCFQRVPYDGQGLAIEVDATTLTLVLSGIDLGTAKRRKRFLADKPVPSTS